MKITLNLLSPEKKEALKTGFILTYAQTMLFIVFVVVMFISGTLLSIEYLLKGTRDELIRQTSSASQEYENILKQVREINGYLVRLDGVQDQFVDWSAVVEGITHAATEGSRIDYVRVAEDRSITVQGVAPTREDVLLMEQRYKSLPFITGVESPLSNILQKENSRFEFRMRYADDVISGRVEPPPTDEEE